MTTEGQLKFGAPKKKKGLVARWKYSRCPWHQRAACQINIRFYYIFLTCCGILNTPFKKSVLISLAFAFLWELGVAASKQRTQLGAGLLLETSQQNSTGVLQIWFWCRGIVVKSTTEETCIGDSPFPSPAPSHVMLVTAEMRRHKSN